MMEILNTICSEEDMKLIHFLLNDTSLRVRTKEVRPTFDTNIGIPQGDGLSSVLFTTYLEEKRGRPSTSLLTTIKHDLKAHKLNIDQAVELVQDRDLWKLEGSRTPANEDL